MGNASHDRTGETALLMLGCTRGLVAVIVCRLLGPVRRSRRGHEARSQLSNELASNRVVVPAAAAMASAAVASAATAEELASQATEIAQRVGVVISAPMALFLTTAKKSVHGHGLMCKQRSAK